MTIPADALVLGEVRADELEELIADGTIAEGMIPKAEACRERGAFGGSRPAHILDGRVRHALLLELLTEEGIGTMVTAQ